ncbi:aminotransferase class IV [Corynebacterium tapiri]|uniref:aminotransferase class IV n=1 Tax=Corynebacterium tapiri TaxID=1448266 RepID=UPI0015D5D10E|nr:aminotransferase class IV [Corynebacterium tapiri]
MSTFVWDGERLQPGVTGEGHLEAADSYLVADGLVVGRSLHEERFVFGAGDEARPFLQAVREVIPARGRWFPRVESRAGRLCVQVRPAPRLRTHSVLWCPDAVDPRVQPTVKGPDLDVLAGWRSASARAGADDALLVGPDGHVHEAANSALVWWEDGRLMVPDAPGHQLDSVTLACTQDVLGAVGRRPIRAEELMAFPVWVGSSLHGWTAVSRWILAGGQQVEGHESPVSPETVNVALWERAE